MDHNLSISELHNFQVKYNFYINEFNEPVFYDIAPARKFIREVLQIRQPEFCYRTVKSFDSEGYQIVVIYVAKPYKIFVKE